MVLLKIKNRDIDFGRILLKKITFLSVIDSIILWGDLCWERDFWNLRIWLVFSFLFYFLEWLVPFDHFWVYASAIAKTPTT